MVGVAKSSGFEITPDAAGAEVIVVNTCGFINDAKRESIETIFELAELKKSGTCEKLVVTGCLSQRYPTELAEQMPEVDHFLGTSDMLKLGAILHGKADRMLVGSPASWIMHASDPRVVTGTAASAYVKIAEGCNRTCAFCTIPQFRGKQRSRPIDDVVREVEQLADRSVVEVNLISQDTIAYGRDHPRAERKSLAELVRRVADVHGIRWVRIFYLYPEKIDEALVDLLKGHPRVVPYVDMPLQHASSGMLARMRRGHGEGHQRRMVDELRTLVPDLVFRTAFIVGHPGETDDDFRQLVDFVLWARFDHVGVFRYSDEDSSASAAQEGKVPEKITARRWRHLMAAQRKIAREKNKARIGQELEVLVEGPSEEHELVMVGRHSGQAPEIDGQVYLSGAEVTPGQMRRVRITQASDYDLVGDVIDANAAGATGRGTGDRATMAKKKIRLKVIFTANTD